jgi:aerotaxis receptor
MRKPSIEAGAARVRERLAALGYEDYEAFMRAAFASEVAARDEALAGRVSTRDLAAADAGLRGVRDASSETVEMLQRLGRRLAGHGELSESLKRRSGFVHELSESIRLFSLNAILSASRLGSDGAALGAVAGLLRTRSDAAAPEIDMLGTELDQAVELLAETSFRAATAKLQAEMMIAFADELLDHSVSTEEAASQLRLLVEAIADATEAVCASIAAADDNLDRLARVSRAVENHLAVIQALEVNGRIEAAKVPDTEQVRVLFEQISKQVEAAEGELHVFTALGEREDRDDGSAARESRALAERMRAAVAALDQSNSASGVTSRRRVVVTGRP